MEDFRAHETFEILLLDPRKGFDHPLEVPIRESADRPNGVVEETIQRARGEGFEIILERKHLAIDIRGQITIGFAIAEEGFHLGDVLVLGHPEDRFDLDEGDSPIVGAKDEIRIIWRGGRGPGLEVIDSFGLASDRGGKAATGDQRKEMGLRVIVEDEGESPIDFVDEIAGGISVARRPSIKFLKSKSFGRFPEIEKALESEALPGIAFFGGQILIAGH